VRVYDGPFGRVQAERLLWRAGFGPRRGDADSFASMGLQGAVDALLDPPAYAPTTGGDPTVKGLPLAPQDAVGQDHLWWLDRMVRGNQPLVERMTLVWHDWFATSNSTVGSQKLMLSQNDLFRTSWDGAFSDLLLSVTQDPAMLLWLNGNRNRAGKPNENYAREMMELFTLGEGQGYTEQDVREQARALTGFRSDSNRVTGPSNFRYDPRLHDNGVKTVFGRSGNFGWQDACNLALQNAAHPTFFVRKLWSYFIPLSELDTPTQSELAQQYVSGGYAVAPLLRAILLHPALHEGPRMVKPPVVYTAGVLRMSNRPIDTINWVSLDDKAGQRLFYPPNVAGWDDDRWLDTQTFRARWAIASAALSKFVLDSTKPPAGQITADAILDRALGFWDSPVLTDATRSVLTDFAQRSLDDAAPTQKDKQRYAVLVENALRLLIAVSPDYQTC
jgi:uncharacterized protein (DUF1800 family)